MRLSILAAVLVVCSTMTVQAQDYRDEIKSRVLIPCMRASLSAMGNNTHSGLSDDLFLQTLRDGKMGFAIDLLFDEVGKVVRGKSRLARYKLYENFTTFCIASMLKNNR